MDPAEERRDSKRRQEYMDMVRYVADSEYGIPTACPCGGEIIHEVLGKAEYDTLPGKRFTQKLRGKWLIVDGLHYRQPWVVGVEQELERLSNRVVEAEQVMKELSKIVAFKQIETLEAQVKDLTEQVDNLTVQVQILEKVCFD
ncbi:hypothetical protein Bca4012_023398 [Brassica carinata]